jgi:hypothetical protein
MENDLGIPGQPAKDGVTVMVAVAVVLLLLMAVNDGMVPLPLAGKPMELLLFVQLKVVPATAPVNVIALVAAPLHTVWFEGCVTSGVGLTVIVNVLAVPGQPAAEGVTVMVAVTGALLLLVAVKAAMFPLPLAGKPIEVLLFVQLYVVPVTEPVKLIVLVFALLHTV